MNTAADSSEVAPARPSSSPLIIAFLSIAGVPILLLVDTLIASGRGWQTTSRLDYLFMTATAGLLLFGVILFATSKGREFLVQRWRGLHLIAIGAIVALVVVEFVLATFLRPRISMQVHKRDPKMQWTFRPSPVVMKGIEGESHFTTNSQGVRGSEMPPRDRAWRILCIGGSTTECIYLDDAETWPAVLMAEMNRREPNQPVWVGNVGISGFWTQDHLNFVLQSDLAPQMDCMIFLVGANDFQKFVSGKMREEELPPVWRKTATWELILKSWVQYRRSRGFVEMMFEDVEGLYYKDRRRTRQQAAKREALPPLERALKEYQDRIQSIAQACREKKIRPVFVTQPMVYRAGLSAAADATLWLGMTARHEYLTVAKLREGFDRYNAALKGACAACGAECIDLAAVMNGREELFYDDAHYNEAGAREVGRVIGEWMVQRAAGR